MKTRHSLQKPRPLDPEEFSLPKNGYSLKASRSGSMNAL
jgi:hypothetical protein